MKWLFITVGSFGLVAVFGLGILVGRQFPAHHFERFGQSAYLYDVTTGKMCNPLKKSDDDPFAAYATSAPTVTLPSAPNQSNNANGTGILWEKPGSEFPPVCNQ
jgi:hypothetical protein